MGLACLSETMAHGQLPTGGSDDFYAREIIAPGTTNVTGGLVNATSQPNEPAHSEISRGMTVWWSWNAPSDGILRLTVPSVSFPPMMLIYRGTNIADLSLVASNLSLGCYSNTACGCHWRTRNAFEFHVAKDQAYEICAGTIFLTDSTSPGPIVFVGNPTAPTRTTNILYQPSVDFTLQFTSAPRNNDFEQRILLSGARKQLLASNRGATPQAGEPAHLGNPAVSSVWYSWTAPFSGRVTISTNRFPPFEPPWGGSAGSVFSFGVRSIDCGDLVDQTPPPAFFPIFSAYTGGSIDSLASAGAFPLEIPEYPHAVAFDALKGETYQIAFDGNGGATGETPIFLALNKPASNDNFKKRIATHGIYVTGSGFNAGATREPGEPLVDTNTLGKSVWWSWIAPVSGPVSIQIRTNASDRLFPIGVFTGNNISTLTLLSAGPGQVAFNATAAHIYQIAVSDLEGVTGSVLFELQGPIVELPLNGMIASKNKAVLNYEASKRQRILLQKSSNGVDWQSLRTVVAGKNGVSFQVSPPPSTSGPFYRAIVVDYLP